MKNIFKVVFYLCLIGLVYYYRNDIINYVTKLLDSGHKIVLDTPNDYYKNVNYFYVKQSENFVPYSKQDLIDIYYSILDRGYKDFTFYCPMEYVNCISDIEKISNGENDTLSILNYFVSPFNSEKKITTSYNTAGEVNITVDKLYSDEDIKAVNKKIDEIISDIINNNMSLEDKILAVHDYIINNTKYDSDALNNNSKYKSYISYGTLIEGYSTCNGYADAMALFLDRFNVPNIRIASSTHVWNAVYLNNKWLHLDLTWDDPITEGSNRDTLLHKFYLIDTPTLEGYNITEHEYNKTIFLEVS